MSVCFCFAYDPFKIGLINIELYRWNGVYVYMIWFIYEWEGFFVGVWLEKNKHCSELHQQHFRETQLQVDFF